MDIKKIDEQKKIFKDYTDKYINEEQDEKAKNSHIDKQNHSLFVLDKALLTDAIFTRYNDSFRNLLALESLFHDIGRFEQMRTTRTFNDKMVSEHFPNMTDHGDIGAKVMQEHGLLEELIPDVRKYDKEVLKVISKHSKLPDPQLLHLIMKEYLDVFRNYDLSELFSSDKTKKERDVLSATNTTIVQDVDRLDIFRKIVRGIWIPMITNDPIDPEIYELFKQGRLPSMAEIKAVGKWNPNVGHLVRMNFINQMNLVPVLMKVRNEKLIDQIFDINGNAIVEPAYEYAKELLDKKIEQSDDGILIKRLKKA